MAKRSFWAARPFGYGAEYPMVDVGQVIEIEVGQHKNDEANIRLGLLREVGREKLVTCGKCGKRFVGEMYRDRHARDTHAKSLIESGRSEAPDATLSDAESLGRLRQLEAADEFATHAVPLNMDKTLASQGAGRGRRASR